MLANGAGASAAAAVAAFCLRAALRATVVALALAVAVTGAALTFGVALTGGVLIKISPLRAMPRKNLLRVWPGVLAFAAAYAAVSVPPPKASTAAARLARLVPGA